MPDHAEAVDSNGAAELTRALERLQGRWRQIRFEENGLVEPPDSHGAPGAVLTITGTHFHVAEPGGPALVEGQFRLAAAPAEGAVEAGKGTASGTEAAACAGATLGWIDWIDSIGDDAGLVLPAIYRLFAAEPEASEAAPDSFEFAAADAGMDRPVDFSGGPGITLRGFRRITP